MGVAQGEGLTRTEQAGPPGERERPEGRPGEEAPPARLPGAAGPRAGGGPDAGKTEGPQRVRAAPRRPLALAEAAPGPWAAEPLGPAAALVPGRAGPPGERKQEHAAGARAGDGLALRRWALGE